MQYCLYLHGRACLVFIKRQDRQNGRAQVTMIQIALLSSHTHTFPTKTTKLLDGKSLIEYSLLIPISNHDIFLDHRVAPLTILSQHGDPQGTSPF